MILNLKWPPRGSLLGFILVLIKAASDLGPLTDLFHIRPPIGGQTWKMSEILPGRDFSFPDFTRNCVSYANLKIATKQRNLSEITMHTTLTLLKMPFPG